MTLLNNKTAFNEYVKKLQKHNTHILYDTVSRQVVYTGTKEECDRTLHNSINPDYYKDFIILEKEIKNK